MLHWLERLFPAANRVELVTLVSELFIAVFLVAVDVIWPVGAWIARRLRLQQTFELRVVSIGPHEGSSYMAIDIQVAVHHATDVHKFNLRFVDKVSYGRFVNVPKEVIQVASVMSREGSASISSNPDEEGGHHCWSGTRLPIRVYARSALELRILAVTPDNWSGYLSFHGYDADDHDRFSRVPVRIQKNRHATFDAGSESANATIS